MVGKGELVSWWVGNQEEGDGQSWRAKGPNQSLRPVSGVWRCCGPQITVPFGAALSRTGTCE